MGFGTRGSLARKAMRIGLGLAVLAVVFAVLHRLADCVRQSASACCPILSTALVYGVLGLTASLGVAWAFRRCGLAESEEVGLGGQVRA
ncbi:hypothetical protein FJY63_12290 [Candidatus Sumerlaeota bacterium]|nr:hypothetical protein [Candidatus Sumerlaeota bacterium]